MNVIQFQAGDYVLLRKQGHLAANERNTIKHGVAFRDQLTPLVPRGILEINLNDPPLRRLPVRLEVELVAGEVGVERGIYIVHNGGERAFLDQVLNIDFRLSCGRAVKNYDLKIMSIVAHANANAFVWAVALAKDLGVAGNVGPHLVEE